MWGGIRPEGTQLEKAPTGEGVGVQSLEPDHYSVNDFLAIDAWQVETLYVCMCAEGINFNFYPFLPIFSSLCCFLVIEKPYRHQFCPLDIMLAGGFPQS